MKNNRRRFTIYFFVFFFFISLVILFAVKRSSSTLPNFVKEKIRWSRIIEKDGAENTYKKLKEQYKNTNMKHVQAHLFGEALYKKMGIEGVAICDGAFGFGCFHGLLVSSLAEKGIDSIKELDKVCIQKFGPTQLGCQHGIGHGILEYIGHEKLIDALNLCTQLTWQGKLFGCQGGVLMEYDFPLSLNSTTIKPRYAAGDALYQPCQTIDNKFKLACINELTLWWKALFKNDYPKLSILCDHFNQPEEREVCYWGIGQEAYRTVKYDTTKIVDICKKMPQKYDEALCRAGAYFVHIDDLRSRDEALCQGLGEYSEICLKKAKIVDIYQSEK